MSASISLHHQEYRQRRYPIPKVVRNGQLLLGMETLFLMVLQIFAVDVLPSLGKVLKLAKMLHCLSRNEIVKIRIRTKIMMGDGIRHCSKCFKI